MHDLDGFSRDDLTSNLQGAPGDDNGAGPAFFPGPGTGRLQLAETLGLAMARRAANILDSHRDALAGGHPDAGEVMAGQPDAGEAVAGPAVAGGPQFAMDDAIFTAILDATNECLGRFDSRPPADRWCDALFYLLDLAHHAAEAG